jgi:hypothetical protein
VLNTTPPTAGTATTFKVTPTVPTGVTVTGVTVSFGDGQSKAMGAISAATSIAHVYSAGGSYNVSATLTDSTGASVTVSTTIFIAG